MIVTKEKLIDLLLHPDFRVREASVHALERFFIKTTGVTHNLIKAIEQFPDHSLPIASGLKAFIPEDDDIEEIIKLIYSTDRHKDDISASLYFHLTQSLLYFPFELLESNQNIMMFNNELAQIYETAKSREQVRQQGPEYLWGELVNLCERYYKTRIESDDLHYGQLLIDSLSCYKEKIRGKVIMLLGQNKPGNYHLQEYLVKLAGKLRLDETAHHLFRIFAEADYMHIVHSDCIRALGSIGTHEVIEEIEKAYESNKEKRMALAGILGYIPTDDSENLGIRLINKEEDLTVKTFLACALCDIFSLKAIDIIKEMVETEEVDHEVASMIDELVPVYAYHGKPVTALSSLASSEKEFTEKRLNNDPLFQAGQLLRKSFEALSKENHLHSLQQKNSSNPDNILSLRKARNKRKRGNRKRSKK